MAAPHEMPSFAVDAQDSQDLHSRLPVGASLLWQDIPNVYIWGNQEE